MTKAEQCFIGAKFNRLEVIGDPIAEKKLSPNGKIYTKWKCLCRCKCGNEVISECASLIDDKTKSCGCLNFENITKKGRCTKYSNTDLIKHPLYQCYKSMKTRCYNAKVDGYFGGNIKICDKWIDNFEEFYNWAIDQYSEDLYFSRKDITKDFNEENCQFIPFNDIERDINIEKARETMIEKYGSWYTQTDEHKERVNRTCLEKYGKDWVTQVDEFKEKGDNTNIERYGFKRPSKNKHVKEKIRLTCQERYGVDSPSQHPDILAKQMKTCMQKYGAPFYNKTNLKTQDSIRDWLKSVGLEFKSDYTVLKTKEIDLYNEDLKIGIEYCGLYWHSEDRVGKTQHSDKFKNATKEGVRLFTIFSDEWKNRNEQVKSFILSALNINVTNLHGRKCITKEINNTEAKKFLETYHIQGGGRNHKFSVGLYHNDELVGVTTFNYHHRDKDKFVLDRLAFKTGFRISGGVSKMLKLGVEYCKANGIDKIITWSDNRWSTGKVYLACGFQLDSELDPDYYYIKLSNPKERLSKQAHTKKKIGCPEGLTEYEYMKELGYDRIWDCGKKRFIINV